MPKIWYKDKAFRSDSLAIIDKADEIINEFIEKGYDLTLRQLYYQFVARGIIENTEKSYKRLGGILNDARLVGMIDWTSIVDRTRFIRDNSHWTSPQSILQSAYDSYRIDKWSNQPYRVEVWIEKDALIGVIERTCKILDVAHFSCRGYVSQSEMWSAAQRYIGYANNDQQQVVIIHLGDHDPSGIDMTRDIIDRIMMFTDNCGSSIDRIALNMPQIEELSPPPNPAKLTDSRCQGYIEKYGHKSWELDAIPPDMLSKLVTDTIFKYRDLDLWKEMTEREDEERELIQGAIDNMDE